MLHRGDVSLRNGVEDVAHKEVTLRMAIRQERRAVHYMFIRHEKTLRTFTHTKRSNLKKLRSFVLSHTQSTFVLSHTHFRTFTHNPSYFHTRYVRNTVLFTMSCKEFSELNTDSNTTLTPVPVDNFYKAPFPDRADV